MTGRGVSVASHEQVWAEVTVARAASTLTGDPLGPLAVLRDHDVRHHSDYLRTLAAWLDHPGAPSEAARSIHVHPNTMRYRMARIADLAALDLDDATVRLAVRLQLAASLPGSGVQRCGVPHPWTPKREEGRSGVSPPSSCRGSA